MGKATPAEPETPTASSLKAHSKDRVWAALAVGIALVAVRGVFSLTKVFYVRDLTYQYWPHHAWFTSTLLGGESLLWDPYPAFGQSAIADPIRQIFFPPVALLRLLLPDTVGFNLSVALPFPIAALGMFLYLRRRVSGPAAALGAIAFAVSGPVLGSGDFMNMAWALALAPYVFLAADALASRPSALSFTCAAVALALQFLAAEPVTLVTTAALAVAYVAVAAPAPPTARARALAVAAFLGAGITGFLLAGVQSFPFVEAFLASSRSGGIAMDYHVVGSVHPLSLLETVMPALFGDPTAIYYGHRPWLDALNRGYEPIIYSLYVGVPTLALASLGTWASPDRRWALFWLVVLVFATILALGVFTPVFPALAQLPVVRSFRFPSKFAMQASFAAAALAAAGWHALARDEVTTRLRVTVLVPSLAVAAAAGVLLGLLVAAPDLPAAVIRGLADAFGIPDRDVAVKRLTSSLLLSLPRLLSLAGATALFVWLHGAKRDLARTSLMALFAILSVDLLVANATLKPTADAALFRPPAWVEHTHADAQARVYVGPREVLPIPGDDALWSTGRPVVEQPDLVVRARESVVFATFPSAYRLRDSVSHDTALRWPAEYRHFQTSFRARSREERLRFLGRVGTSYFVLPYAPADDARMVADVEGFELPKLWERPARLPRATVVPAARVVADTAAQTDLMFGADFDPSREVLLDAPPPAPTPASAAPAESRAEIVEDTTSHVVVRADVASQDGYLVLADTFDRHWSATVDGEAAPLLRANGQFRAVRLGAGEHVVRFEYRPKPFYAGALVTPVIALALVLLCVRGRRKPKA